MSTSAKLGNSEKRDSSRSVHLRSLNTRRENQGSIVLIAPIVALLAVTLAALLVDLNFLYTSKAELADRVEAAATAAANNLSLASYYHSSTVVIDPAVAQAIAKAQLSGFIGHGYQVIAVATAVIGNSICVDATANVALPAFAGLLGTSLATHISARTIATLPSQSGLATSAPVPAC